MYNFKIILFFTYFTVVISRERKSGEDKVCLFSGHSVVLKVRSTKPYRVFSVATAVQRITNAQPAYTSTIRHDNELT